MSYVTHSNCTFLDETPTLKRIALSCVNTSSVLIKEFYQRYVTNGKMHVEIQWGINSFSSKSIIPFFLSFIPFTPLYRLGCSSGKSLASHRGGPGLVMWDLWWIKWRWGRFSQSTSVSPCQSFIPPISPQSPPPIIWGWYNIPVVAAVPRDSVSPH
jgi:hypothetical protein